MQLICISNFKAIFLVKLIPHKLALTIPNWFNNAVILQVLVLNPWRPRKIKKGIQTLVRRFRCLLNLFFLLIFFSLSFSILAAPIFLSVCLYFLAVAAGIYGLSKLLPKSDIYAVWDNCILLPFMHCASVDHEDEDDDDDEAAGDYDEQWC